MSFVGQEDLPSGAVLSARYRIGVLVGRGAMGAVYEAMRLADGARVALKVLSDATRGDPFAVQRFEREAQAASLLGHPCIVRVFDFHKEPNEPAYLVMEFLEGHSLGREIEAAGAMPPSRVVEIAKDVLAALAAAHRAGLVHRDIKPDNIVVVEAAASPVTAKLVDFGVVKMVNAANALTRAGQVLGTPAYMAPEQWLGRAVDARTDLYALGGCMYHALMGRTAVASVTEAVSPGFSRERARVMPRERPLVSAALAEVVARALSSEPLERFGSADEMAAALRGATQFVQTMEVGAGSSHASASVARTQVAPAGALSSPRISALPTSPPPYQPAPMRPSAPPYAAPPPMRAPMGAHAPTAMTPMPAPSPYASTQLNGPVPAPAVVPWWKTVMARNLGVAAVLLLAIGASFPSCCLGRR